jgi:biopolymer transport protein TolR
MGGLKASKKNLEAELNLTSFIDLLSTCVCFLLITAVWIQIGSLEIKQSHGSESKSTSDKFDLDVQMTDTNQLKINLKKAGKILETVALKATSAVELKGMFKETIEQKIVNYKNQPIEIQASTFYPHSSFNYGDLVVLMDVLRSNKITNIGIGQVKGGK